MVPGRKKTAAETREEPTGAELFDEEVAGAKSLADLAGTGGAAFEGELVTLESIQDERVMVLDYKLLPSTFREGGTYVCFSARTRENKMIVVNTNAMVPVKAFAAIVDKGELPMPATFFMQEPKSGGKPYWNIK